MFCLWTHPPNTYPGFKLLQTPSKTIYPIFWLQNQFLSHRAYATQDKKTQQSSSPAFPFLGPNSLGAPLPSESTRLKTSRVTFTSPSLSFSNPQGSLRPAACLPNTFHSCITLAKPTANFLDRFFIISYHTIWNLPVLTPPAEHHANLWSRQRRRWKTSLDFSSLPDQNCSTILCQPNNMNPNALKILSFLSSFSTLLSPTQQSPFIPSNKNAFHPSASSSNHLLEHLVSILSSASRLQPHTRYSTDVIV